MARVSYERTLWDDHAIRWAEHLVNFGRNDEAALLLRRVGVGLDDEGALAEAIEAVDARLADVYSLMDATIFRSGKRVRLPSNPCPNSWAPERPCVRAARHPGVCEIADVNTAHQRQQHAQLLAEMGAVAMAVLGASPRQAERGSP